MAKRKKSNNDTSKPKRPVGRPRRTRTDAEIIHEYLKKIARKGGIASRHVGGEFKRRPPEHYKRMAHMSKLVRQARKQAREQLMREIHHVGGDFSFRQLKDPRGIYSENDLVRAIMGLMKTEIPKVPELPPLPLLPEQPLPPSLGKSVDSIPSNLNLTFVPPQNYVFDSK